MGLLSGGIKQAASSNSELSGYKLAKTPLLNKGHSFTSKERDELGLRGLYPAGEPMSLETKVAIAMDQLALKTSPIEKYIFLHTLQDSDETLFYATLIKHTSTIMPFVYTPTVGEACQKWGTIYRHQPRGIYLSLNDKGKVRKILDNHPSKDIKAIVFTDGERILGLGDLGVNGMGIPIGKLALYTACAGINPAQCLPVHIDVGTNTKAYHTDPTYMGLRRERERGLPFDDLIKEFFDACQDAYGKNVLLQFEDFGNSNAFRLLETYKNKACCFNDDIQGTASVVLAGLISSLGLAGKKSIADHTFLFNGAGEAGVGIAQQVAVAIQKATGCSAEAARKQIWLCDSQGLITNKRPDLSQMPHHKLPFAHDVPAAFEEATKGAGGDNLLAAVRAVKPTGIIGVSAQGGSFTEAICKEMAKINEHPVIFALSNPTSKAECTATQAYTWTDGKCVYASGSPFDQVTLADGRKFTPGQGNNAYIFPGVGLGAIASGATSLTDDDMIVAAFTLSKLVSKERLDTGCAYPPLSEIREVSAKIAAAVAANVYDNNRGDGRRPQDLLAHCKSLMYVPQY